MDRRSGVRGEELGGRGIIDVIKDECGRFWSYFKGFYLE